MIVIKIKTWKDWKKEFIHWVQAPRRKTCKEYVDYMEVLQKQTLYRIIEGTCDKYNNMREDQIKDITEAVEKYVAACAEETRKLIDKSQPTKIF